MLVGGFVPRAQDLSAVLFSAGSPHKLPLSSLHVIGDTDKIITSERSLALAAHFEGSTRTVIRHNGGHYIPGQKNLCEQYARFFRMVNGSHLMVGASSEKSDDRDPDSRL
eukprot:g37831.t1